MLAYVIFCHSLRTAALSSAAIHCNGFIRFMCLNVTDQKLSMILICILRWPQIGINRRNRCIGKNATSYLWGVILHKDRSICQHMVINTREAWLFRLYLFELLDLREYLLSPACHHCWCLVMVSKSCSQKLLPGNARERQRTLSSFIHDKSIVNSHIVRIYIGPNKWQEYRFTRSPIV